jgi:hypothetical protein
MTSAPLGLRVTCNDADESAPSASTPIPLPRGGSFA